MKTILVTGSGEAVFQAKDPNGFLEVEFESSVLRAFSGIYKDYRCVVFGGGFSWEGVTKKPDLALVARDFSHWFILEVELLSHSLENHVLPQMMTIRNGEPASECAAIIGRELGINTMSAETLIRRVPYGVAVVANGFDGSWETSLKAIRTQFISLSVYVNSAGYEAFELSGSLSIANKSLGFGKYYANSQVIKLAVGTPLPIGSIQFEDEAGTVSLWEVMRDSDNVWVAKSKGRPIFIDGSYIQIISTVDGRLVMRSSYQS